MQHRGQDLLVRDLLRHLHDTLPTDDASLGNECKSDLPGSSWSGEMVLIPGFKFDEYSCTNYVVLGKLVLIIYIAIIVRTEYIYSF